MRVKNPDKVHEDLIASALQVGALVGLPSVSVETVARGAGVTKGALFHHFPTKRALVEAAFDRMLEMLEADLAPLMECDPEQYGRFTRAYLRVALRDSQADRDTTLWRSCVADAGLSKQWDAWLQKQLARLSANERGPRLEAVRLAADGLWLGITTGYELADAAGVADVLIALTSPGN